MTSINILSQSSAVILTLILSIIFLASGIYYSRKHKGLNNYLIANRSIGVFSLTTSFVSSALGAWILFGPASAATWGGIGAVIGYALGTAFPLFILIYLGEKFEKLALEVDEAVEETYDDLIKILRQEGDGPCLLEHKDFADDFRGNKIMLEPSEEGIFAYILNKKEQRIKPRTIVGKFLALLQGMLL